MKRTLPVSVYLALVFVSGLLVGALGMRLYVVKSVNAHQMSRPGAEEFRRRYIADLQHRLNLTPDQVTAVNGVLDDMRDRFRQIHDRIEPDLKQLRQEQNNRVRALLTAQQQTEYDRWHAEREKMRK